MTTSLSIRNQESLTTGGKHRLSIEVNAEEDAPLFLWIPLGKGAGALMTDDEFKKPGMFSVAKAELEHPNAEIAAISVDGDNGKIKIELVDDNKPARFCIYTGGFETNDTPGSVTLHLKNLARKVLADTEVEVVDAPPRIVKFESDKYCVKVNSSVNLKWKIEPPGGFELWSLAENRIIESAESGSDGDEHKVKATGSEARFRLNAKSGEKVTDTSFLTVSTFEGTAVKSEPEFFEDKKLGLGCAEILGVYAHGDWLYAVVRDRKPNNGATLWRTQRGFVSEDWKPLTKGPDGGHKPIKIPVEAASRPGAVFDDKLYFMGGSSFDDNFSGTDVGYFHFETNTWVDVKPGADEAWSTKMKPRMGHGLVVSPDGQTLWVIGGYNDAGALDDIWIYEKGKGWRSPGTLKLPQPRCLFGVTFNGPQLWIGGGFENPGGDTFDDLWYLDTSEIEGGWQWRNAMGATLLPETAEKGQQYCGCALAAMGNAVYAFAAYSVVRGADTLFTREFKARVRRFTPTGNKWQADSIYEQGDWVTSTKLPPLDCYRLDATVYRGVIFVRRLAPAKNKDTCIHYLVTV